VKQSHARTRIIVYLREHPQEETEKAMSEALGLRKVILKGLLGESIVVECESRKATARSIQATGVPRWAAYFPRA
jgi:hypothetical protein